MFGYFANWTPHTFALGLRQTGAHLSRILSDALPRAHWRSAALGLAMACSGLPGNAQANTLPAFTSSPYTGASEGTLYNYEVTVSDSDIEVLSIVLFGPPLTWLNLSSTTNNPDGTATAVLSVTRENQLHGDEILAASLDASGTRMISACRRMHSIFAPFGTSRLLRVPDVNRRRVNCLKAC